MASTSVRQSILAKFDKRWVGASLAAAGAAAAADKTQAAIVYFNPAGGVNIPVTVAGVYVDIETGATSNTSTGFTNATRPVANLWGTSSLHTYWYPSPTATNRFVATGGGGLASLTAGTPINAASTYAAARGIFTAGAPWDAGNFTGLIGFKFRNNANTNTYFGWGRVQVNPLSGGAYAGGKLIDWAYDDTGGSINAGQTPEPTTIALLALGAAGLVRRRRVA